MLKSEKLAFINLGYRDGLETKKRKDKPWPSHLGTTLIALKKVDDAKHIFYIAKKKKNHR